MKSWWYKYQLTNQIWGFTLMELFGILLIVSVVIGIIQY